MRNAIQREAQYNAESNAARNTTRIAKHRETQCSTKRNAKRNVHVKLVITMTNPLKLAFKNGKSKIESASKMSSYNDWARAMIVSMSLLNAPNMMFSFSGGGDGGGNDGGGGGGGGGVDVWFDCDWKGGNGFGGDDGAARIAGGAVVDV
jgi:uncharacterized membrane protein YgcG